MAELTFFPPLAKKTRSKHDHICTNLHKRNIPVAERAKCKFLQHFDIW